MSLAVLVILLSIGTQHSVAQTNLSPSASPQLADTSEPSTFRLKGAIVKTPPAIKVPGLQAGLLTEVAIKEGGRVTQGQFLARIDPTETQLSLEQSKLDHQLAVMNANNSTDRDYFQKLLVVATAEVNRSIAANNRVNNSVPLAKLEKQRLEQERAALQLQQANRQLEIAKFRTGLTQSEIKTAEVKLAKTKIVAPVKRFARLFRSTVCVSKDSRPLNKPLKSKRECPQRLNSNSRGSNQKAFPVPSRLLHRQPTL